VVLHGGVVVPVTLSAPDFKIDWEIVRSKITDRTQMIMINTPHNPSGSVLSGDDLLMLQKITEGTDIIIISDEVYEHIIFDGLIHESILRYPKLMERSLIIYSFGKTYHNTGWKMGYVLAPKILMQEFRSVHQFLVFSVNTPIQYALADFMEDKSEYENVDSFYQQKRDLFLDAIKSSRFTFTPAIGNVFSIIGL
jgi:methionine aminotransferase